MTPRVTHVRLHTREAVEAIIKDAHEIADSYELSWGDTKVIFEKACDLLAAGVVLTPQPSMPLHGIDLSKLGQ